MEQKKRGEETHLIASIIELKKKKEKFSRMQVSRNRVDNGSP